MINLYDITFNSPLSPRQLSCGESLIAQYDCPLPNKMQDAWSHHNYLVYVISGRKIWHTPQGSYDLRGGSCIFVRKGASVVEQFFDTPFCVVLVFLPDEFITRVLQSKVTPVYKKHKDYNPVIPVDNNKILVSFFESMASYLDRRWVPDQSLVELKFRELVLTLADNPRNSELLSFFGSLLTTPQSVSLRSVMEENFLYNLKLKEFARLSNRSLSAFKRDFKKEFKTTPAKWLMNRRLHHAMHLLSNTSKTVSESAFESGFENPSHFSRAFRNQFGMPPGLVRMRVAV